MFCTGWRRVAEVVQDFRARGDAWKSARLQRNVRGDFSAWHRGRVWFLLWALDVDVPALRPLFAQARQQLAPWLLHGYRRQPHVTLGLCGFPGQTRAQSSLGDRMQEHHVAGESDSLPDACSLAGLRRQVEGLERSIALSPFRMDVGGAGSFTSAPFLAVHQGGELQALRAALALDPALQHLDDYLPHVTLGLFRESWLTSQLQQGLRAVDGLPTVSFQVRQVQLMAYAAADVGGPLVTVAAFDLRSRRLRWNPPACRVLGESWLKTWDG